MEKKKKIFLVLLLAIALGGSFYAYYNAEEKKIERTAYSFALFYNRKSTVELDRILCSELGAQKEKYYSIYETPSIEITGISFEMPPILMHAFSKNRTAVAEIFTASGYIFFVAKHDITGEYCIY